MLTPFESFLSIWNIWLIIFGANSVLVSVNCIKSDFTPKTIAALVLIGSFSYIIVHGLKISLSAGSSISNTAESLLIIPMALAELTLALWLTYRTLKLVEEKSIASNT